VWKITCLTQNKATDFNGDCIAVSKQQTWYEGAPTCLMTTLLVRVFELISEESRILCWMNCAALLFQVLFEKLFASALPVKFVVRVISRINHPCKRTKNKQRITSKRWSTDWHM
jgi:hypothetical protein